MTDLDFSDLTNDQIVELAAALAHEALRRSPATAAAFEAALVSEKERVAAAARGAEAAKHAALRAAQERAQEIEAANQREIRRQQDRDAMAAFLRAAARITGRSEKDLTLVWNSNLNGLGPRLHLNAGTTGDISRWHLVNYDPRKQMLRTTPGLSAKTSELLAWARETTAGAQALNLGRVVVQGVEL